MIKINQIFKKLEKLDENSNSIYKLTLNEMNLVAAYYIKLKKNKWHPDTIKRYIDSFAENNLNEGDYNLWNETQ